MKKSAVVYISYHHKNTEKVAKAMGEVLSADVIDLAKNPNTDIGGYDLVGFASGIYFNSFDKRMENFISRCEFKKTQQVFLAYTCGIPALDYAKRVKGILKDKGVPLCGVFRCRGYDSWGIFGKIGGIAKTHPDTKDISAAQDFAKKLLCEK